MTTIDFERFSVLRELEPSTRATLIQYLGSESWQPGRHQQLSPGLWLLQEGHAELLAPEPQRPLTAGSIFGFSSLWSPATPMPTIHSLTYCEWLYLSQAAFVELKRQAPQGALDLLTSLLRHREFSTLITAPPPDANLGLRQTYAGSSAEPEGHPRSRPELVTVQISGQARSVRLGTPYHELLPERDEHLPVVAALVDNKAASLNQVVTSSCRLEPLTTRQWEGQRIYRHSLALLALEAAHAVAPELRIRMGPSVGFGRRILAEGLLNSALHDFATRLEAEMMRLRTTGLAVYEEHWTVAEARDYFRTQGFKDAYRLLDTWRDPTVPVVSYGSVYVLNIAPVLTRTELLDSFFVLYDDNLVLLVYGKRSEHSLKPSKTMPPSALTAVGEIEHSTPPASTSSLLLGQAYSNHAVEHQEQAWLQALGVTSIGAFNRACVTGSVPGLIRVAEGFQEKRLMIIADAIQRRSSEIDIVCIAGPSASGKTTFIRRLSVQLQVNGIQPVALSLDDYYIDRVKTPRDPSGDYDFESLGALQLDLLQDHLKRLLAGQPVKTARYDFVEGVAHPAGGRELRLRSSELLLLEGIHGLNPALLADIPQERVFRVFVCPLMQLSFDHLSAVHASDVRLIRRIVRDRHGRSYSAADTIARWPKVRAGERQHIYPYQIHADAVFDSSLIYELSVLRVYAERYLLEIPDTHSSYQTGFRLMHLLDRFVSIYPDQVPATSILREFVGGSGFEH